MAVNTEMAGLEHVFNQNGKNAIKGNVSVCVYM